MFAVIKVLLLIIFIFIVYRLQPTCILWMAQYLRSAFSLEQSLITLMLSKKVKILSGSTYIIKHREQVFKLDGGGGGYFLFQCCGSGSSTLEYTYLFQPWIRIYKKLQLQSRFKKRAAPAMALLNKTQRLRLRLRSQNLKKAASAPLQPAVKSPDPAPTLQHYMKSKGKIQIRFILEESLCQ